MLESKSEWKSQEIWFTETNEEFCKYLDLEVIVKLFLSVFLER